MMSIARAEILPALLPQFVMRRAQRALAIAGLDSASFALQYVNELVRGEPELHEIGRHCDPERLSIDIGAADGLYLRVLRKHSAACVGFEPNPAFYRQLQRRFPHLRLENCALSSAPGTAELRVPVVGSVAYRGFGTIDPENTLDAVGNAATISFTVAVKTLDSFLLDPVGLVKIDVEGHEFEVLLGSRETIDRCRPNFMIEIEERHHRGNLSRITGFFSERGYRGYFLIGGALRPIEEFDLARHQDASSARRRSDYHNNFFFLSSRPG
jgi:FkbM family methyltransferase